MDAPTREALEILFSSCKFGIYKPRFIEVEEAVTDSSMSTQMVFKVKASYYATVATLTIPSSFMLWDIPPNDPAVTRTAIVQVFGQMRYEGIQVKKVVQQELPDYRGYTTYTLQKARRWHGYENIAAIHVPESFTLPSTRVQKGPVAACAKLPVPAPQQISLDHAASDS